MMRLISDDCLIFIPKRILLLLKKKKLKSILHTNLPEHASFDLFLFPSAVEIFWHD